MTLRFIERDGLLVADDRGPAAADAVLLLHGFTGDRSTWSPVAERLAMRRRVIVPDLPGHGATRLETVPDLAGTMRMLAELLAVLGVRAAAVVGYSMGGRLALAFALAAPARVDALVLESASPGLATEDERRRRRAADEALAASIERDGIAAFAARWEAEPLFATQPGPVRARLREQRCRNDAAGLAASLRRMGTGAQPWLGDRLPELRRPVLLVTGERDDKFGRIARAMESALPDAQHVVVADAGHAVHLERPDVFGAAVETFLDQRKEGACRSNG
jgi:2-succinyl-6-hydroxy-2,4-cyclohexadiene-1-carboxylate synthase